MRHASSIPVVALALAACGGDTPDSGWTTAVDTLPNGVVHVVNTPPASEDGRAWTLEEELRIGSVDGTPATTFGQVKALVVDSAGRIIVLESQAQEVRVFDRDGAHVATYGGRGGGPGEFENALGIMQASDGLLYLPDQRNARMSVLSVDSGFLRSHPLTLYRWGFVWSGVMTQDDRILVPSMVLETRRDVIRVYSPDMTQIDSILLPEEPPVDRDDPPGAYAWQSPDGRVRGFTAVPFYPRGGSFLDRTGERWSGTAGDPAYRIVRTTLSGDTTLILETRRTPLPVSEAERDSALESIYENLSQYGVKGLDASKIPAWKPSVLGMFTDADGRLWVRTSSPDSLLRYDVYEREGRYVGSVATDLNIITYIQPVVQGDEFLAIVADEMDVPYVVRARIPRQRLDPREAMR